MLPGVSANEPQRNRTLSGKNCDVSSSCRSSATSTENPHDAAIGASARATCPAPKITSRGISTKGWMKKSVVPQHALLTFCSGPPLKS